MRITIFGTGYVGLVTGACFADVGHQVCCVDIDAAKLERLRAGEVPIHEPGLADMVAGNMGAGRLSFTDDAAAAVAFGEVIFIAVGTPSGEDGSADLTHVLAVADTIGTHLDGFRIIVDKSTVPVGTADRVRATIAARLAERGVNLSFDVCSNPEFLKEGDAIEDFNKAARIVVGASSEEARQVMRDCYAPLSRNRDKLMFMDVRSAELTKYAANTMLAAKISLINEMALLAERLDADIEAVRLGIGSDPRIGYHFIYPGCGYGGSCFPKDVRALARTAREQGLEPMLIEAIERVNDRQKGVLFEKVSAVFDGALEGRTIALWGLAFKPGTDDMREAPSRTLMEALWAAGASIRAFDPEAMATAAALYGDRPDLILCDSQDEALEGADALVICTEWRPFRVVDPARLKEALRHPVVVDGRNLYEPAPLREAGLLYYPIGRGRPLPAPTHVAAKAGSITVE